MSYHESSAMSSSEIACFLQDPIEWYHLYKIRDWPRRKPTPSMEFGSLVHKMFEVGGFENLGVTSKPEGVDLRTKAGKQWKEENSNLTILDTEDFRSLQAIWENSQRNDFVMAAISDGEKEAEHFWDDPDFGQCRCKPDCLFEFGMLDWKTTCKTSLRGFVYEVVDRAYDVRMAFYRRWVRFKTGSDVPVFLVAINTAGGCHVVPYEIDSEWLDDAEARLYLAIDDMRDFDIEKHCNRPPKRLIQPRFSEVNFNEWCES